MGTLFVFFSLLTVLTAVSNSCMLFFTTQLIQLVRIPHLFVLSIAFCSHFVLTRRMLSRPLQRCVFFFFQEPMVFTGGHVTAGGFLFVSFSSRLTAKLLHSHFGYTVVFCHLFNALHVSSASSAPAPPCCVDGVRYGRP